MAIANVIVTCTKSKTVPVPASLKLRAVKRGSVQQRASFWLERLKKSSEERIKVENIYKGDHWSAAKDIRNLDGGEKHQIWVCSAGYGLLSLDDKVPSYSATFSGSNPDSVVAKSKVLDRRSGLADWWDSLCKWPKSTLRPKRSVQSLAVASPDTPLIVIGSDEYLFAMQRDLQAALAKLSSPNLLSIFSAGCKQLDGLDGNLIPYDARMQNCVGGALRSLNMRVARWALEECGRAKPTKKVLQKRVSEQLKNQPAFAMPIRKPITDDAVRKFILRELNRDPRACHSPLLRKLRKQNKACEQKRFANLFHEVKEHVDG